MADSDLDLSETSIPEAERHLGHLVRQALSQSGACVLILRDGATLTSLPWAKVFAAIAPEELAFLLLDAGWADHEVENILYPGDEG